MGVILREGNFGDFRAHKLGELSDGFECGQRRDEFFAGAEKGGGRSAQDLPGAAAEHQLIGFDGMRFGNSFVQGPRCGIGGAIRKLQGVLHGSDYFLRRPIGIFIAA